MDDVTGVFEGGGIKGVALAGGAAAALDLGFRFPKTAGTSAGAIVASLVAAGLSSDDLDRAVQEIDWPEMIDRRALGRVPWIGPHLALLMGRGVARGAALEHEIAKLLDQRAIRTFADLPDGALKVVATDLTHGAGIVLPDALPSYGIDPSTFSVARAVRASSAVPFVFEPVRIRNQDTGEASLLVDGAFAARFPIQVAEPGSNTLGFKLVSDPAAHDHRRIRGPLSLAAAVIAAGMTAREALPVLCRDAATTIEISVDRHSLDFALNPDEAHRLFHAARVSAAASLERLVTAPASGRLHSWPSPVIRASTAPYSGSA